RTGRASSVAGSNVITGVGTLWANNVFGIAPGQMIFVPGAGQVFIYEILSVDSDTKIRVTRNIATAITNSEYAIVTTVSNSMSDLARRTAVKLALYQKLLEDWQDITTGTGDVTIIAPDGSTVVIPSLSDLTAWVNDSKTWFDDNRELIENAGEAVAGALSNLGFGQSVARDGYLILPGGLIMQWGTLTGYQGDLGAGYPIAFKERAFQALTSMNDKTAGAVDGITLYVPTANLANKTSLIVLNKGKDLQGTVTASYFVIGK
ncbi:TPA: hypothetical protein ACPZBA_004136, partial [Yersinia enterocolitica]